MGSFDGAELCELVGLFLLSKLASIIGKSNFGLYRDDGLAILKNTPGPDIDSAGYCWISIKVCYCQ